MALSSCPIAFSNKSNVFTNAHRNAWVYMRARTRRCVHTRMPEARNGSRLLVEQPRIYPLLFTRFILAFHTCARRRICASRQKRFNQMCVYVYIYIVYTVYIYVVHSRIKAFNIGKRIDTRSDRRRSDSAFLLLENGKNGSCYRFVRVDIRIENLLDFC